MFYWQVVLGIGVWGVPSLSGWRELEQGRGASASVIGRRRVFYFTSDCGGQIYGYIFVEDIK